MNRLAGHLLSMLVGAIAGGLIVLLVLPDPVPVPPTGDTRSVPATPAYEIVQERPDNDRPSLLLAWAPMSSGGVPESTERIVEDMPGVIEATTVLAGLHWMDGSRAAGGATIDDPPPGYRIPIETAVVDPAEYARFIPPSEREAILALRPGDAVLAETAARIRGAREGLRMSFEDGDVTVTAVVSDIATNGYEMLISGPVPSSWLRVDRFVLMHLRPHARRGVVAGRIESLLPPGQVLRIRAQGETPFLRYGDAVLPEMLMKKTFGEFPARPLPDGGVDIPQAWRDENLRRAHVPVLGWVTCHRVLIPQLRRALGEIKSRGLSFLVNTAQYGGCFGPRFIGREFGGRLSHHSWGAAIDLNVMENAFGTRPDQDPRLVRIMEDSGFTWGGRWLVPDGMHFEWVRFP